MSDTFSKVEVITGVARRRRFSTELKLAVVAETMQPGMSVSYAARRYRLSPSLVCRATDKTGSLTTIRTGTPH
jgi:transposase